MLDTHKFPATSTGQRLLLRLSHALKRCSQMVRWAVKG